MQTNRVEHLSGVGLATAQTQMKAIGEVQAVAGAHFIERQSLLLFLDEMIAAPAVEYALRTRLLTSEPPPRPKSMRFCLPPDLRNAMSPHLSRIITPQPGRLEVRAHSARRASKSIPSKSVDN